MHFWETKKWLSSTSTLCWVKLRFSIHVNISSSSEVGSQSCITNGPQVLVLRPHFECQGRRPNNHRQEAQVKHHIRHIEKLRIGKPLRIWTPESLYILSESIRLSTECRKDRRSQCYSISSDRERTADTRVRGTCTTFCGLGLKYSWFASCNPLFFYYSYVHTRLGSFLPPAPTPSLTTHSAPSLSPHPLNTQQKLFCPYF
jgi:hypothetical protein